MSEPLATSDDVVERLGRDLTDPENARIDAVLLDASNAVRAYTGQQFTETESTVTFRIKNRAIRFPQQAVTAVASIVDGVGNDVPFTFVEGDTYVTLASTTYLNAFELNFPAGYTVGRATVTYTHGYATIPQDIVGIVAQLAARAVGAPADEATVQSETIGSYSYSNGAGSASGPFGLLDDEKYILDRYRILAGPVPAM